jgi:tRNA nucleotidyltransferase (CCA-adding enzyme)
VKIYLVGGAVRDQLLGLSFTERDWVVVGATPEEMVAKGYRRADRDFPVFLHPETGDEYALARSEVKVASGYKGFALSYGPEVTLEQDLLRRDLTINALAMDESGRLIDVCQGRRDLDEGVLRHITPAFVEDPLRLLRIARFAAKLGKWGFRIAHKTHGLMKKMAVSSELETLSAERIWGEMSRAMAESQPWRFFEVLQRCGALQGLLPEVAQELESGTVGHRAERTTPLVDALKQVASLTDEAWIRTAVALFHSAEKAADPVSWMQQRRIEKKRVGQLLNDLLKFSSCQGVESELWPLFDLVASFKPLQQPERFQGFLLAAEALWPARVEPLMRRFEQARQAISQPVPQEITRSGLQGKALGAAIRRWRLELMERRLGDIAHPPESG